MRIRDSQIRALARPELPVFEREMVVHLRDFAPLESANLGDEIRPIIHEGVRRAGKYNLTGKGPLRLYLELMFLLGSDFDSDPQYPWAARALQDPRYEDEDTRAAVLHDETMRFLEVVSGPDQAYHRRALERIGAYPYDRDAAGRRSDVEVIRLLEAFHPQRCCFAGEDSIRAVVSRGRETARRLSITSDDGILTLIVLMFQLGHGIVADPIFPYVGKTLHNQGVPDPNERAERLHLKTLLLIDSANGLLAGNATA